MIKLVKRSILRVLTRFGYHVLKAADYQAFLARPAAETAAPISTNAAPAAAVVTTPLEACAAAISTRFHDAQALPAAEAAGPIATEPVPVPLAAAMTAPPEARPLVISPPFDDAPIALIRQRVAGRGDFTVERLHALYSAAKHITALRIEGDVLDCGWGDIATLLVLAASLLHLNSTGRRLVMFDVSAGPLHSVEFELGPWGADYQLLHNPRPPVLRRPEPPLADLSADGYPAEQILVRRYPREPIAYGMPIAFLSMNTESYDANRKAFEVFYPRLSAGGVLTVEDSGSEGDGVNFINAFLRDAGVTTPLSRVCPNFYTLIKPGQPSQ